MKEDILSAYGLRRLPAAAVQAADTGFQPARILAQDKGQYRLVCEAGEFPAVLAGSLRYAAKSAAQLPAVGDFVWIDRPGNTPCAVIHGVLPRKSVFLRKAAGTDHTEQVVAANIDTVFICMSLNLDFNLRRLERYLTVARSSGAAAVIVLTKSDLCSAIAQRVAEVRAAAPGTDVLVISSVLPDGWRTLLPYLRAGETAALIGSSGVGKSTLVNQLLGQARLAVDGLRNDDKGRHTTTRRELFLLACGGMLIDTPGMRELGLWDAEEGLAQSFSDLETLAAGCRFRNCTHHTEPGCAVRAAIADGRLSEARWRSYEKLRTENRYSENSGSYLAEKRKKFKTIAQINKTGNRKGF